MILVVLSILRFSIFGFFGELETDVGFRDMFHLGKLKIEI